MLAIGLILVALILAFNVGRVTERFHLMKYGRGRHETKVYVHTDRRPDHDDVRVYSGKNLGEMHPHRGPEVTDLDSNGEDEWP